jgi:polyribonucleotide nucleotidyltransferase
VYLLLGPSIALYLQWVCSGLDALVRQSSTPIITDIKRQAKRVEKEAGWVVLKWLSSSNNCEAYEAASAAAQRAARQQPKQMRSASLSFVKQAVKEKWKPTTWLNKHIKDAKKSVAA